MLAGLLVVGRLGHLDHGPRTGVPVPAWSQGHTTDPQGLAIPGDTEIREGHTVWDDREEWCLTVSRTWCTATPEQVDTLRAVLAELAGEADQDAVVLHVEQRELITT